MDLSNPAKAVEQWTLYENIVLTEAGEKKVSKYFDRANPPQPVMKPNMLMLGDRPVEEYPVWEDWEKFMRSHVEFKWRTYEQDCEKQDENYGIASSILVKALWEEGRAVVAKIQRERIPRLKFQALANIKWPNFW